MKKTILFTIAMTLVSLCACTNDENEENERHEVAKRLLTSIDYTDSYEKCNDAMKYDDQGRIILFERKDSDNVFASKEHFMLEREITTEYQYDLENNKIYIKVKYHYPNFRKDEYMEPVALDKFEYDTLFISNNRVESIHKNVDGLLTDWGKFRYSYFLDYDSEGRISKLWYSKKDYSKDSADEYDINWENGNLVSLTPTGKINYEFYYHYKYNSDKGECPIFNVFTLLFDAKIGLLASDGWFGAQTTNLISDWCEDPTGDEDNARAWSHITYEWENQSIQKCHVTRYKWNMANMTLNWK